MSKILQTIALAGLALTCSGAFAATFVQKEMAIIASANHTLKDLGTLLSTGQLSKDTALKVIQKRISPVLNYQQLSRTALGKNWRNINTAQRKEISELFRILLEKIYATTLAKFSNQTVRHEPTVKTGSQVSVLLWVKNRNKEITIEYILMEDADNWEIIDLKVEKISLLSNYRRQFNSIIRKSGADGLIALLKQKT